MLNKIVIFLLSIFLSLTLSPGEKSSSGKKNKSNSQTQSELKPSIIEEVEVVGKVTLDKTIQSVTVYSREDMKHFNSDGLKSFLNQCPGFLVLNGGHFGQFAYTFARGASVNQTLFLIDGSKITDPSSSIGLNTTLFSPDLFEKVEIVRGPLSNLYGSSAMGGVVNLKPREKEGIEASAFLGSHGTYEGNLFFSKKSDHFKFTLNGNWIRFSDGVQNDEFTNRGISIKSDYQNGYVKTSLLFFGNFSESGIPFNLGNPTPNRQYKQNNYIFILPFSFNFQGSIKLNMRLSHNHNSYDFQDPDDTWTPFYLNKSTVNEGQISIHTIIFKNLTFNIGLEYSDQKIINEENAGIQLDNEKTNYFSAFLNTGLDLKKIQLSASLRYDKYKNIFAEYSPQLGFAYLISKKFKIRGSYSESFRAPTLPELLNPLWGNPDLEPEKGKSFEIGGDFYTKSLTLSLVYFNSKYENLIGYSPVTWAFANINQANISGIELSLKLNVSNQVILWGAYTYLDTHDFQNNQELIRRPKHSFSAMISYENKYFSISSEMIYVGRRLDYDELVWTTTESPSFDTYNFNLNIPVNDRLSVIGKATNAFNRKYQEILGYPAPGRRFLLGIKYKII